MNDQTVTPEWLNMAQLAMRLNVSISTIRGWIRRGVLPSTCYMKLVVGYRFNPVTVEEFFQSKTK